MNPAILYTIVAIFCLLVGGYTHETDIQNHCKEHGHAGQTAWRGDFTCAPIKK